MTEPTFRSTRGAAKRALLLVLALVVVGAAGGGYWYYRHAAPDAGAGGEKVLYTCGMHPWIIADRPGDCPVCGMKLTRIDPAAQAAATPAKGDDDFFAELEGKERKILFYRNPMDPMVTSPVPAVDPMGMDYVPVYADEAAGPQGGPPGMATVTLTAEGVRLAGVQTAVAARERLGRTVRTVGQVVPDETRIRHVHTKIAGWIEELHVNFTGQEVKKGAPLLTLYSPELLASQEEFLRARLTAERFRTSPLPEVRESGERLLQVTRSRLELFDVPKGFIAEIERTGVARRTVPLVAPVSGVVTAKQAFEGLQVEPGMELFTITDLSRVWIEADVYEYEARSVRVGQAVALTLPYDPGVRLTGKVSYVYPYLQAESRTLKVRFEFPNPGLALKPSMYADVELSLEAAEGVVIPDSAVIDTGTRQVVFAEKSGGVYEPRVVRLGLRAHGRVLVLEGVAEGERVAVKANFLL
ncbi:MAG: efflux RND transporter periplasmic adaptor subunit, partial [Deferrisomatales bacterium]